MRNKGLVGLLLGVALSCVLTLGTFWFIVYFVNGDLPELETTEYQNLPIKVHDLDTGKVSIEKIIFNSLSTLRQWLPDARYNSFVFSGKCRSLSNLDGIYSIRFWQKEKLPFRNRLRILSVTITVDTVLEKMDIKIMDASNYFPNTIEGIVPTDDHYVTLLSTIHDYTCIASNPEEDITITHLSDYWDIRCGRIDTFEQKCNFGIKDKNFEIFQP